MRIQKKHVCFSVNFKSFSLIRCFPGANGQSGFTLMELLVAVAMIGILFAVAVPALQPMWENSQNRKAARDISSVLRETRSRAISENLEHEASFNLSANTCLIRRGDRPNGTPSFTSSPGSWTQVSNLSFPAGTNIKGNLACNETINTNFTVQFNPDGTGNNRYLCVEDGAGVKLFASGVSSSITGRVRIRRWDTAAADWEQ